MRLSAPTAAAAVVAAFVAVLGSTPAHAQFRNAGIQGSLGWLGLGTWDLVLNEGRAAGQRSPDAGWNLYDQPTLGFGHFFAVGYDLWVENQAVLGVSATVIDSEKNTPVLSLSTSHGLRYNFLSERIRPYLSGHLNFLFLVPATPAGATSFVPFNGWLGGTPLFFGLRPGAGVEWIFGDEQSIAVEASIAAMLVPDANRGLGGIFLPLSTARLLYLVYF